MAAPVNLGLARAPISTPPDAPVRCDLAVAWESPWQEFGTSVHEFFFGARPATDQDVPSESALRVDWVQGRLPGRAFLASSLWHVAAIFILILPIWGFLPQPEHTLPPVQIEVTYIPAQDLPRISLPAHVAKASEPAKPSVQEEKPAEDSGSDAYHPRQTILSVPVKVTHPRQTLIQPDVQPTAPKIDVQLPNMVQWASAPAKPQLRLSPTAAAPKLKQRAMHDVAVPEVANNAKDASAINIASSPVVNFQPQMPMSVTTAVARQRETRTDASAAPEISGAASESNLHRLIALSATPGPAAPVVNVPQENLAARVSVSPAGKPGAGAGSSSGGAASTSGPAGAGTTATNSGSLPAAISVSGGTSHAGGIAAGIGAGRLNLKPAAPDLTVPVHRGPSVVGKIDPSIPPEKILSGKEVYTLDVNLPNLTSVAGSWVLNFAQLDETDGPALRPKGQLSGPVPVEKVDPKYPPELIKEHVEGQVVLYAIIGKDGIVRNIQVVHSVEPELDKDAIDALAHWKFRPGMRDGAPVDLEAVVYIPFRYRPPE